MTRIILLLAIISPAVVAQDAHWATAAKDGCGTSTTLGSKVWFTLANGVMTEVFYPTLDVPNVQTLQMLIATKDAIENEVDETSHRMELPNPNTLTFRQINTAKSGQYTIRKTYITDPRRNTVLIDVDFKTKTDAELWVQYDPSLNNSGLHDIGWRQGDALVSVDKNVASALMSSCGFAPAKTNRDRSRGNVVQTAALKGKQCTLALGFGESVAQASVAARASLARGFEAIRHEYETGWQKYVATLPRIAMHQQQFNMAAMVLKGLEDKTFRGAVIASPSSPWGGGPNANESTISGYHAVS